MMKTSLISALSCRTAAALTLIGIAAAPVAAQQVNASAAAAGVGGNFTARARGSHAVAWNPANLGLSGNPGFSLQIGSFAGVSGLNPIDLADIAEFDGVAIPAAKREEWLKLVEAEGGQKGSGDLGVGLIGLSIKSLALQVSTVAFANANLNDDAVEAIFFGNAGRTGTAKDLNFAGSSLTAGAFTTAAVSYGFGFGKSASGAEKSFGVTGKYILGNGLAMARDNGSSINSNNVQIKFPMVQSDPDEAGMGGTGIGLDLGFGWKSAGTSFGVVVMNAVNSFKWDESKLVSRDGNAYFTVDSTSTSFEEEPFTNAPADLKQAVADHKFKPTLAIGLAKDLTSRLTISADARQSLATDESVNIGPKTSVGVGAELRVIPMIPLRAGANFVTGGFGVSAGAGIRILGFELGVAGTLRNRDNGQEAGGMISIVNIR